MSICAVFATRCTSKYLPQVSVQSVCLKDCNQLYPCKKNRSWEIKYTVIRSKAAWEL
jgi:hypothetical protein